MARSRATQDKVKPRSDAYVGLLFIALLAQIAGAVFFYLDWSQYPSAKPPAVPQVTVPAPAPAGGQQGGAGAAGQQAGMGGGMAGMAGQQAGMGGGMAGMMGKVN